MTKQGGLGILITIAYRNIWRNIRRTVFCFTAAGIAVFFIIFYGSFIGGMTEGMNKIVQIFETGHVKIVSLQYEAENEYMPVQYPISDGKSAAEMLRRIKEIPGVRAAFPRISSYATLQESVVKHATLWGLEIEEEMKLNNFNLTDRNNGLVEGGYPHPDRNECAIGFAMAQKTGFKIGDEILLKTVSAEFSDKFWSPKIVGIFRFDYVKADKETLIVDFSRLQRLLVLGEGTQQLVVFADKEPLSAGIAGEITKLFGEGNVVRQWRDNYWLAVMEMTKPIMIVVYFVFLIVASFLIINTVMMIIHERIKEIGMMGSLGMTRSEIVMVFFFESLFLSFFGALAGVILGGLVTGIGQFFPFRWGDLVGDSFSEMPTANAIFLQFSPGSLVRSWLMGVGVSALFTLIPSLKSAFVEPVEALRR